MLYFNTAGPVNVRDHFTVDPLERPESSDILRLVKQKKYFLLHAPRQTGKTSLLIALAQKLNELGEVNALYLNVEPSALVQDDHTECFKSILAELTSRARDYLHDSYPEEIAFDLLEQKGPGFVLNELLTLWAKNSEKPLVLLFDEVDTLDNDILASFLKQIRSGFDKRPDFFPQSIVLCGVQDIRHMVVKRGENRDITGGDIFNIDAKSIRLGQFSSDDVRNLFNQYGMKNSMSITNEASEKVWELTQGQPWLVNAIACELVEEMVPRKVGMKIIDVHDVDEAAENLIQRQEVHMKNLTERLKENRVRRIISPILMGSDFPKEIEDGDMRYLIEQGFLKMDGSIEIANPIYKEIIPRALIQSTKLLIQYNPTIYQNDGGGLDIVKILSSFQTFFGKHNKIWSNRFAYKEASSHLFLQAFLQRIVDGGGRLNRHYDLGRKYITLIIDWPTGSKWERYLISSRYIQRNMKKSIQEGAEYMRLELEEFDRNSGHLVLFYPPRFEQYERKQIHQVDKKNKEQHVEIWGI